MSQDHNHLNHATWECKYQKGHLMPDHVHADIDPAEIFGGGVDRVSEREEPDPDCQNRKLRNSLGHKFWARGTSSRPSGGTRR